MKILYLGSSSGTSLHRANALTRIGHQVEIVDPGKFAPKQGLLGRLAFESGGISVATPITNAVRESISGKSFDMTWVDGGRFVGPKLIRFLQKSFGPVVNLNVDDPFSYRDRLSWSLYKLAVKAYDLVAVVRHENVPEAKALGASKVVRVFRAADEVAHRRLEIPPELASKYFTEVIFVGTGMESRGQFMASLIHQGVPLSIVGNSWEKQPEWKDLQPHWKAPGTTTDEEYALWSQCSDICIGMLSKGNRDLHTTRSLELPAMGCLFCAERTTEHLELYKDGEEAIFWDNKEECASKCRELLRDDAMRKQIRDAGYKRSIKNGNFNENVAKRLISELGR